MAYRIEFKRSAKKAFDKLQNPIASQIAIAITALADDPRPQGAKKLVGSDQWRIRIRDYRVVYSIHDDVLTITVVKLGHRRDIYER